MAKNDSKPDATAPGSDELEMTKLELADTAKKLEEVQAELSKAKNALGTAQEEIDSFKTGSDDLRAELETANARREEAFQAGEAAIRELDGLKDVVKDFGTKDAPLLSTVQDAVFLANTQGAEIVTLNAELAQFKSNPPVTEPILEDDGDMTGFEANALGFVPVVGLNPSCGYNVGETFGLRPRQAKEFVINGLVRLLTVEERPEIPG